MRTARELYEAEEDGSLYVSDYNPMLSAFGAIALQVDDKDYHGDSRVLYDDDGRVGYLQFGWGSCSGCDALQGCDNIADIQDLMDRLQESIRWFDSYAEALKFFETHDWQGEYSFREEEQGAFVAQSIEYLKPKIGMVTT